VIEVIDKEGWRKRFGIERAITHIGSDPRNDIALESWRGGGVAPRHLQLIALPNGRGYRLVNLGGGEVVVGEERVPPRASADVAPGTSVKLGDFTLIFMAGGDRVAERLSPEAVTPAVIAPTPPARPPAPPPARPPAPQPPAVVEEEVEEAAVEGDRRSEVIGLEVSLPRTRLSPDEPLEGTITVRNLGERTGVQFRLEVEGWPAECYEIGPAPILFPNAERDVPLRLYHPRGGPPLAGKHTIRVRATAPGEYPGEVATVSQEVEVEPFYDHSVRVLVGSGSGTRINAD